jgi:integrase
MSKKLTQEDGLIKRNGIWYVRVMLRGKRYKKAVGPRKEDAQLVLEELRRQRSIAKITDEWSGLDTFTKKKVVKTFRQVATQYLEERQHLKPITLKGYREILNKYLLPEFGDVRVVDISEEWVAKFQVSVARKVSPVRTNNVVNLLRYILKVCARRKWIPENPALAVDSLKEAKPDIDPFPMDELKRALDALHPHYRPLFTTLAFTGCRPNELFALRWSDVDFKRKQIIIRKGRVRGDEGTPKTRSSNRTVPMLGVVEEVLRQLKASELQHVDGFVFLTKKGQPFNKHADREWAMALKKARLKHRASYQLRHTFASYCLERGCDPAWVSRVLGHSSIQTTFEHYARFIRTTSNLNEARLEQSIAEESPFTPNKRDDPTAEHFTGQVAQIWYHGHKKGADENVPSAPVSLSDFKMEKWWRRRESHSRPKKSRNKSLQV